MPWREARRAGDLSAGGLRAYSDEARLPGERLEMELFFPERSRHGGRSAVALVEVVWVEPLPLGAEARFDVGLHFVGVRPEDLVRIERLVGGGEAE